MKIVVTENRGPRALATWQIAIVGALLLALVAGGPAEAAEGLRRHGLTVLRPDIQVSGALAGLERVPALRGPALPLAPLPSGSTARPSTTLVAQDGGALAVRLGLASVRSIGDDLAAAIVAERDADGPFADLRDLARRVRLTTGQLEALATSGALDALTGGEAAGREGEATAGGGRRAALWGLRLPGVLIAP